MILYAHDAPIGVVLEWALFALGFLYFWGRIDGTDAWDRKRRAEWKKH